jgi:predicted SnoaL-like aldol condensation-catalyzing enzyme
MPILENEMYKTFLIAVFSVACAILTRPVLAQVPVRYENHDHLLASSNPQLAANKRLVYDFWREVIEARHLELADKYMTETYIQHNPNVPTGRAGFIGYFSKYGKPKPIWDKVSSPIIAIVAEGDLVTLVFAKELPDPKDQSKRYTTTWFDMFRIENGKIAEHWDAATKQ